MTYISIVPFTRINEEWLDESFTLNYVNTIKPHPIISGLPNSKHTRYYADFYKKIALDIVAETVYNYRYPYISEKTLRPLASKRMFIIVGAPRTLELLKAKGFQTFSDVIDEEYDLIDDPVKRWRCLENTIKSFTARPIEDIRKIIKDKSTVLEHNFKTLAQLQSIEITQI
jgi:hypothetical protein